MVESRTETIPSVFRDVDTHIAESAGKDVYGYNQEQTVLKVNKEGSRGHFSSSQEVIQVIQENEIQRRRVREILQELGSMNDVVPPTSSVVHDSNSPGGGVTYSEVQTWYQDAQPLSQVKGDVRHLSQDSLNELRNIFKADIRLWEKDKRFLDIIGSDHKAPSHITNQFRYLFPLFSAENILIDAEGNPKFIDVEGIDKQLGYNGDGLKSFLRVGRKLAGDYISIGLINLAMLGKGPSQDSELSDTLGSAQQLVEDTL